MDSEIASAAAGAGQAPGWLASGGLWSTVGAYSRSCNLPSKTRLSTISSATSGYPSTIRSWPVAPVITGPALGGPVPVEG